MKMNTVSKTIMHGAAIVAAFAFTQIAMAQDAAKVIFKSGNAIVKHANGKEEPLSKNSALNAGDTIETRQGRVQFKTIDGGKVSLQPETVFKFTRYEYSGAEDGSEYAITELVKGGLRTITGVIGHKNRDRYQLKTPVATIGIRGTEFSLTYGNKLVMSTLHGSVDVCNAGGCVNAITGQSVMTNAFDAKPIYTQEKAQVGAAPASKKRVFVKARNLTQTASASDTLNETLGENTKESPTPVFNNQETDDAEEVIKENSNTTSVAKVNYDTNGYDASGYDKYGYDANGYDKNGFNAAGFDVNGYNANGYDKDGYNAAGFNQFGYDINGLNAEGFNVAGYDANGYDANGYDKNGYDVNGYNSAGYNSAGYDANGFNAAGYDINGFDVNGLSATGYDVSGYDANGYDINGFDINGFNAEGYDANGYDANGFNVAGYDANGFDANGYDANGFNSAGFDSNGFNASGYDANGFNAAGYNIDGFNIAGFDSEGYNINGYNPDRPNAPKYRDILVTSASANAIQTDVATNGALVLNAGNGKLQSYNNGTLSLTEAAARNVYLDEYVTMGRIKTGTLDGNQINGSSGDLNSLRTASYISGNLTTVSQMAQLAATNIDIAYNVIASTAPTVVTASNGITYSAAAANSVTGGLTMNFATRNYGYNLDVQQIATDGSWNHNLTGSGTLASGKSTFTNNATLISTHPTLVDADTSNNAAVVSGAFFGNQAQRAGLQYDIKVDGLLVQTNTNTLTGSVLLGTPGTIGNSVSLGGGDDDDDDD